ncbi:MAG: hypothetical protein ACREGJ_01360 [Candidatus Saccharimonadales bacterium]
MAKQESYLPRTGPVGRLARVFLFALLVWLLYNTLSGGIHKYEGFGTDTVLWAQTGLALFVLKDALGMLWPRIGFKLWLWGVILVALVGAVSAFAVSGMIWAAPLPQLVWIVNVVGFSVLSVEFLLAIFLGTPGCEKGVIAELRARSRDEQVPPAPSCIIGLHHIDAWEAQHRRSK